MKRRHTRRKKRRFGKVLFFLILLAGAFFIFSMSRSEMDGIKNTILSKLPQEITQQFHKGSVSIVTADPDSIPEYSGEDVIILNENIPGFTQYDCTHISGEHYSNLDLLGRCGPAYAMLDQTMMPTRAREGIGQIKPSGWNQAKYEGYVDSDPPYLYNRCHLIAYALSGQNANELNLITGTRYMNATLMLPYEEQVMQYLDSSTNHVLYRVTPYFKGTELLARGVEMEAYSVEDQGKSLSFHVFVYNVQPGIGIDYRDGASWVEE